MKMDLEMNKIVWAGLIIMALGVGLELAVGIVYSIDGIPIFPFMMIPAGVLITLAGFMKGSKYN
jgi:hypothetical protein